eukprot:1862225-Rhodomonas_salina.1
MHMRKSPSTSSTTAPASLNPPPASASAHNGPSFHQTAPQLQHNNTCQTLVSIMFLQGGILP